MSSDETIARWLDGIRHGDAASAEALWNCCFPQLVRYARDRLRGLPCRAADGEDIALSAMRSFYAAAEQGRFDQLADRNDLFRLLLRMTARKAVDLVRRETSLRRGKGRVRGDSALGVVDSTSGEHPLADDSCTPELAAIVSEEVRRLLNLLDDPDLQALALARMEGRTNQEIAQQMHCSERTVERRLHLIREIWQGEESP